MNVGDLSELIGREILHQAVVNLAGRADIQLSDDVQIKKATSGFEGFLSIVLRVKVSYTLRGDSVKRSESLFVKCLPREKFQLDMVKLTNVFMRESVYYGKVLPLMKKVAAGNLDIPLPKCYHAFSDGVNDVIYLEDLEVNGFSTAEAHYMSNGLDWEHISITAKNLGVLHALTIAAEKLLPEGKKTWIEAFPVLGKDAIYYVPKPGDPPVPFKGVADTGNEIVVEVAGQMPGLPKMAAESGKLRCIMQSFWSIICELVKPNSKGVNVLSHGDCWFNNLMFQYKVDEKGSKKPVGSKFVDLQMAKYCHPSIDLLFFMHISISKDVRDKYYDKVIDLYYNSLEESLQILNFGPPPFSLGEFTSDLKDVYKPFGVYFGAVYSPCQLLLDDFAPQNAEAMTAEKFQEIVDSGNVTVIRKRLRSDPVYRSKVELFVKEFVELVFPDGSVNTSPFLK